MKGTKIWHILFGEGTILEEFESFYLIDFNKEPKKISKLVWKKYLFLSEDDFKMLQTINEKYEDLLPTSKTKINQINNKNAKFDDSWEYTRVNCTKSDQSVTRYLLQESDLEISVRNIVVLVTKEIHEHSKCYLQIFGIDVFTGKCVRIVDTNGAKKGGILCSKSYEDIKRDTVIQAEFKWYDNEAYLNTVRIVSDYKVLGQSNMKALIKKYNDLKVHNSFYTQGDACVLDYSMLDQLLPFLQMQSEICCIIRFSMTQIKEYKSAVNEAKLQIKMGRQFIDILDPNMITEKVMNKFFVGYAVLLIKGIEGQKCIVKALRLIGKLYKEEQARRLMTLKREDKLEYSDRIREMNEFLYGEAYREDEDFDEKPVDWTGCLEAGYEYGPDERDSYCEAVSLADEYDQEMEGYFEEYEDELMDEYYQDYNQDDRY